MCERPLIEERDRYLASRIAEAPGRVVVAVVGAGHLAGIERVFGTRPRILDGSRAVLLDGLKLQLEAGERELWLIEMRGVLGHRLAMVEVKGNVEDALREAKARLDD